MEYIKLKDITEEKIKEIVNILKLGGVIITPTDTVYGIIADSLNEDAIKKIYDLKNRKYTNPMSVVASDINMINKVTKSITDIEKTVIEKFLPGPLTIIFEKNETIPEIVTAGKATIRDKNTRRWTFTKNCRKTSEIGVVATSCNAAGEKEITNGKDALEKFKNKVDVIIDGGETKHRVPSSIIKIEKKNIIVLREGPIKKDKIEKEIELCSDI